ncbi:MAG: glycoside hydrolase family 3 C-terminal domain-containing protein [Clostridiales bacterium]|nr:glycoside hydrolase family 3 C-terminal domain-containing protein [Clostridiales bacterium]
MEKGKRLKMSNKVFRRILTPLLAILTVVCIVLNVAAVALSTTLDTYLGAGETYLYTPSESVDLDANYYTELYSSAEEATEAAYEVAQQVAEEGSVLLKNNGVLPLEKGSSVMPFGYAYLSPIYGQLSSGGSAKWVVDPVTPEEGLSAFNINTAAADLMEAAGEPEALEEAEGTTAAGEAGSVLGGDCRIYEYDSSIYDSLEPVSDTTGIVFISRSGQEGQDQKYDAYEDGTPHYLALSENEKGAIRAAKETCGSVVVILVSSAVMELGDLMTGELEVDAILWVGHPGEKGFNTLSDLLDGDVNPSGRTVDIYPSDLTADPSYQSVGTYTYSNLTVSTPGYTGEGTEEYNRLYNEYIWIWSDIWTSTTARKPPGR